MLSWRRVTALLALLISGCRSGADLRLEPARFPPHSELSARGFAEEALFGYGTPRTPKFDDYTKGSYHVAPVELARALPSAAAEYRLQLLGVVVVGPYGPLWAYDVVTFVQEPSCTRVNWLLMPHARITQKWSGCLAPEEARALLGQMHAVATEPETREADSCLAVGVGGEVRLANFDCYQPGENERLDALEAALTTLRKGLHVTYSSYPPVRDEEP